jgi:hypothetical protein
MAADNDTIGWYRSGVPNLGDAGGCKGGRQCLKKWIEIAIFAIKMTILNVFFCKNQ